MLGRRKRGSRGAAGAAIDPGVHANGVLAWGTNRSSRLGGGYFGVGDYFPFPQGVLYLTKIVQIDVGSTQAMALDDAGKAYWWGGIDAAGGPLGYNGHPSDDLEDPTLVVGGIPLYPEETLKGEGEAWVQRRGPVGPLLPKIKAVSTTGGQSFYLTDDGTGRVLSAGGGPRGQLGSGWNNVISPAQLQKAAGEYGQFSPFWVLTGGPAQSETGFNPGGMKLVSGVAGKPGAVWAYDQTADPTWGNGTRANVLKDVKLIRSAQECCYFVKTNNELWLTGQPVGLSYAVGLSATFTVGVAVTSISCGATDLPLSKGQLVTVRRKTEEQLFFLSADVAKGATSLPVVSTPALFTFAGGNAKVNYDNVYATKDPTWDPTNTEHLPTGYSIIGIDATHSGVMLTISNGTASQNKCRFIGNSEEYMAGDGKEASATTSTREVLIPKTGPGVELEDVKQVGKGEYSIKVLTNAGVLYTAGSNLELQQGLGNPSTTPQQYLTPITSLNAGGRKVVEVATDGEYRGGGRNGGEMTVVRLDDNSVRTWGWGWNFGGGASINWIGFGTLGTGKSANSAVPVAPLGLGGSGANIKQVATTGDGMLAIQEPGAPPVPSLLVTNPAKGVVVVAFEESSGAHGALPPWRAEESWTIRLNVMKGLPGVSQTPITLPAGASSATFTGVPPGKYEAVAAGANTTEEPAIVDAGGKAEPIKTPSAGKGVMKWLKPIKPEPSWIGNWRRIGIFIPSGVKAGTVAAPGIVKGAAITSIPVAPFPEGIPGAAKVRVTNGANSQIFVKANASKPGQTTLAVQLQTALFDFPAGSEVVEVKQEDWKRTEPEVDGALLTLTFDLTTATGIGLAFEEAYEAQVEGAFRGSYRTRKRKKITVA